MPRAQISKATVKLKKDMSANSDYQIQCWLEIDNGWDEARGRRNPMTPQQQAVLDQVHKMLLDSGIKLQMTIKERVGQDVKSFPATCYADLFVNQMDTPQTQPQQQPQQGGNSGSGWGNFTS